MFILWYPFELLIGCFLIETIILQRVLNIIENNRDSIHGLYKTIGWIDTCMSILRLREETREYCIPVYTEKGKSIFCEDVIHPLIDDCIPNSLNIQGKSLIITGSNMSGKTTFLRAMAINNILGRSINTCFAKRFEINYLNTFSSIRITDDLFSSKSLFLEEVCIMKDIIDISMRGNPNLLIIDEIFKGTNTRERIASAQAILQYLNKKGHIILFSTHDLELIDLLGQDFEVGYFSEEIDKERIIFDYKIKIGKNYSTNAIRVLELNNYPKEIIENAYCNLKQN